MANREIDKHLDGQTVGAPRSQTSALVGTRNGHGEAGERSHRQLAGGPDRQPGTEDRVAAWLDDCCARSRGRAAAHSA